MIVMGIDQSLTSTAYVVVNETKEVLSSGVVRSNKEDSLPIRCRDITQELVEATWMPEILNGSDLKISIEGLSYGSIGSATRNLAVLMGWIQFGLYTGDSNWVETPATSLKKFATGNGKAEKVDMLEAVPEEFREHIKANYNKSGKKSGLTDLPDAYHLAIRGVEYFGGKIK